MEEANSHLQKPVELFWSPAGITQAGCNLFTLPRASPHPTPTHPAFSFTHVRTELSETLVSPLANACHSELWGKQSPRREFLEELKDGCDMSLKLKGAVTYKRWSFSQACSSPIQGEVSHHYLGGTDGAHQQPEPGDGRQSGWPPTPHLPAEEHPPHHCQPCSWQIPSG